MPDAVTTATEAVPCNLCGQDDYAVVTEHDRYGLPTRIVQCRRCALQYINPRMRAEDYAQFYAHEYRALLERFTGRSFQVENIEDDQWMYAARLANTVAPWMPTQKRWGRVVDIGGSTGIVGRLFKARWGYDVTVIDPCAEELRHALGCQTVCASAETAAFPRADVALLCRTIDHLLDPLAVLRRARDAAGLLIVDAVDVAYWPSILRYKVDHPYAFTAQTLRAMTEAAGWKVRTQWSRLKGRYTGLVCSPQE